MANIKITNLYAVGFELFKDSESFLSEIVDNEPSSINGGIRTPSPTPNSPWCYPTIRSPLCKPSLPRPIRPTLPPEF
ncbi:hypothetical protein [Chroococcidiopsis sp. CCNUC1]|uniref:hypothetical protein n=1 Tax=Chroococcidiopsis sp. CCNUC1 TaxID=2653189 RepID=UPI00201FF686|nr:hypothetical protein [Chroococcidiopsis sp. CCNUC1]URD48505.1 hypothetical protein M5J74_19445 [Chroococcidiopsis sp. CCNUC1]